MCLSGGYLTRFGVYAHTETRASSCISQKRGRPEPGWRILQGLTELKVTRVHFGAMNFEPSETAATVLPRNMQMLSLRNGRPHQSGP